MAAGVLISFSEPLDPASISDDTLELSIGGSDVAGEAGNGIDGALQVSIAPHARGVAVAWLQFTTSIGRGDVLATILDRDSGWITPVALEGSSTDAS